MSDEEKRRHPRVPTQQTVWVEGQDLAAEARNMSKGGMFVVAQANAPAVGSTLQLKFNDPHEGEVDLRMEVVWREESTMNAKLGLRVLDSKGMEAFERVVSRHTANTANGARDSRHAPEPADARGSAHERSDADAVSTTESAKTEPPPGTPPAVPDVDK